MPRLGAWNEAALYDLLKSHHTEEARVLMEALDSLQAEELQEEERARRIQAWCWRAYHFLRDRRPLGT